MITRSTRRSKIRLLAEKSLLKRKVILTIVSMLSCVSILFVGGIASGSGNKISIHNEINYTSDVGFESSSEGFEFYIRTEEDLRKLSTYVNSNKVIPMTDSNPVYYREAKYILKNDIVLTQTSSPIGRGVYPFKGVFDGNGYTIYGLNLLQDGAGGVGFFGETDGAEIVDLNIENTNATMTISSTYTGGLVGRAEGTTIENCSVKINISVSSSYTGGLVGYAHNTKISKCQFIGDVANSDTGSVYHTGGLVGLFAGNSEHFVRDCYFEGNVSGINNVGGAIGWVGGASNDNAGRILLEQLFVDGNVSGQNNVGGVVGTSTNSSIRFSGLLTDSGNKVSATGNNVGGLVGSATNSRIAETFVGGNIEVGPSSTNVGGLVGGGSGSTIDDSYTLAIISSTFQNSNTLGYVVGQNVGTVGETLNTTVYYLDYDYNGKDSNLYPNVSNQYGGVASTTLVGDGAMINLDFSYWNSASNDSSISNGSYTRTLKDDYLGNFEIKGKLPILYNLTYHKNLSGSKSVIEQSDIDEESNTYTTKFKKGDRGVYPNRLKVDNGLNKWYKDDAGSDFANNNAISDATICDLWAVAGVNGDRYVIYHNYFVDTNGTTHCCGGTISGQTVSGTSAETVQVYGNKDNKLTLAGTDDLTCSGYVISGWNTSSDGTGTSYTSGQTIDLTSEELHLYPKTSESVYTVTYNAGTNGYFIYEDGNGWTLSNLCALVTWYKLVDGKVVSETKGAFRTATRQLSYGSAYQLPTVYPVAGYYISNIEISGTDADVRVAKQGETANNLVSFNQSQTSYCALGATKYVKNLTKNSDGDNTTTDVVLTANQKEHIVEAVLYGITDVYPNNPNTTDDDALFEDITEPSPTKVYFKFGTENYYRAINLTSQNLIGTLTMPSGKFWSCDGYWTSAEVNSSEAQTDGEVDLDKVSNGVREVIDENGTFELLYSFDKFCGFFGDEYRATEKVTVYLTPKVESKKLTVKFNPNYPSNLGYGEIPDAEIQTITVNVSNIFSLYDNEGNIAITGKNLVKVNPVNYTLDFSNAYMFVGWSTTKQTTYPYVSIDYMKDLLASSDGKIYFDYISGGYILGSNTGIDPDLYASPEMFDEDGNIEFYAMYYKMIPNEANAVALGVSGRKIYNIYDLIVAKQLIKNDTSTDSNYAICNDITVDDTKFVYYYKVGNNWSGEVEKGYTSETGYAGSGSDDGVGIFSSYVMSTHHKITFKDGGTYKGAFLFDKVYDITIKNLDFYFYNDAQINMSGLTSVGGLVAQVYGSADFSYVNVDNLSIYAPYTIDLIGGFVGEFRGGQETSEISYCNVKNSAIMALDHSVLTIAVGGFVGDGSSCEVSHSTIQSSNIEVSQNSVSAYSSSATNVYIGGVFGTISTVSTNNSFNILDVSVTDCNILSYCIRNSLYGIALPGQSYAGGICGSVIIQGSNYGQGYKLSVSGTTVQGYYAGGMFGYVKNLYLKEKDSTANIVSDCTVKGMATGGGIVGYIKMTTIESFNGCVVSGGTISSLWKTTPNIYGNFTPYGFGGIAGIVDGKTHISNCTVDGANISAVCFVGGICGASNSETTGLGDISGCVVKNSTLYASGYAAPANTSSDYYLIHEYSEYVNSTTTKTTVRAKLSPEFAFCGGIVGYKLCGLVKENKLINSKVSAKVEETTQGGIEWTGAGGVGGIVGVAFDTSKILSNYTKSDCSVSGFENIGGIVGYFKYSAKAYADDAGGIVDCINNAYVEGWDGGVGGIVGRIDQNAYNADLLKNTGYPSCCYIDGNNLIQGTYCTAVYRCANHGEIGYGELGVSDPNAENYYLGGIAGSISGSAIISGANVVDRGIESYGSASIKGCYNTGLLNNCYSECGGIVGSGSNVKISYCFNVGRLSGTKESNCDALIGEIVLSLYKSSSISNCYYWEGVGADFKHTTTSAYYDVTNVTEQDILAFAKGKTKSGTTSYPLSIRYDYDLNTSVNPISLISDMFVSYNGLISDNSTYYCIKLNSNYDEFYLIKNEFDYFETDTLGRFIISNLNDLNKLSELVSQNINFTNSSNQIIYYSECDYVVIPSSGNAIGSTDNRFTGAIGSSVNPFTGTITSNDTGNSRPTIYVGGQNGLFAYTSGATIRYLIINVYISSAIRYLIINANNPSPEDCVGGVVGEAEHTTISYVDVSGTITGADYVGGVVGYADDNTTISNVDVSGTITGADYVGGVAGDADDTTIQNVDVSGTISGEDYVGGICGCCGIETSINHCENSASINGSSCVGGIAGYCWDDVSIQTATNRGEVEGKVDVGGICGYLSSSKLCGVVNTASVYGTYCVGGLVGYMDDNSKITNDSDYSIKSKNLGNVYCVFNSDTYTYCDKLSDVVGSDIIHGTPLFTPDIEIDPRAVYLGAVGGLVGFMTSGSSIDNSISLGSYVKIENSMFGSFAITSDSRDGIKVEGGHNIAGFGGFVGCATSGATLGTGCEIGANISIYANETNAGTRSPIIGAGGYVGIACGESSSMVNVFYDGSTTCCPTGNYTISISGSFFLGGAVGMAVQYVNVAGNMRNSGSTSGSSNKISITILNDIAEQISYTGPLFDTGNMEDSINFIYLQLASVDPLCGIAYGIRLGSKWNHETITLSYSGSVAIQSSTVYWSKQTLWWSSDITGYYKKTRTGNDPVNGVVYTGYGDFS